MSAPALAAPGGRQIVVRGTSYPVVLPKLSDPRLHLAAVIISLQILGQVAFSFRLSIAQILISLGTCAVLEVGITLWRGRVLMWPASALLTGNGVAFVLRVPGTEHGDWWSLRGWWIFAATAAVALLSKYVIRLRGGHIFNPSNIGLVVCFLALRSGRADPLDFWWGPMDSWMALALAIIVVGGVAILWRLRLLVIAAGFWIAFAAAIGVVAAAGHAMTARWSVAPVTGFHFWWVLVTSPEILVFLFFMITDPRTTPRATPSRIVYAVSIGLLAALLIAPVRTEFWSKVAVLGALAIVCLVRALAGRFASEIHPGDRKLVFGVVLAAYFGALVAAGVPARPEAQAAAYRLPGIDLVIHQSKGVSKLDRPTASQIGHALLVWLRARPATHRVRVRRITVSLGESEGQSPPAALAAVEGARGGRLFRGTFGLTQSGGTYMVAPATQPTVRVRRVR